MADGLTTVTLAPGDGTDSNSAFPSITRGVYQRQLLERAMPDLMHQRFAQIKNLKERSGQSMCFRRYEKLDQATAPLTEYITPTGTTMTNTDVYATIAQYGNYVKMSTLVKTTHFDPLVSEASELMGENMGESIDTIHANLLAANVTNVVYCDGDGTIGGTANGNVDWTIHKQAIDYIIRELKGADAKPFVPMVPGSVKVNTYPLAKSFWCLIHTDQEHDLYNNTYSNFTVGTDFIPVERYAGHQGAMDNEVGKYRNVRFITSTNVKIVLGEGADSTDVMKETTTDTSDVYYNYVFARNAYGVIPLNGNSTKILVKDAKSGGSADPLEQRNTVGWKAATTLAVLNQNWIWGIRCATLA